VGPLLAPAGSTVRIMQRLRSRPADAALAVALSVLLAAMVAAREWSPVAVVLPLTLLQSVPLAWRRVRPLPVLGITVVAAVAQFAVTGQYLPVGVLIALYTVAAYCQRPVAIRAALATGLALGPLILIDNRWEPDRSLANAALLAVAWTFGAYLGELRGRAARAERERDAEARRAVAEEQARIARELHDVIAHNVSVMVVQAAAAGDIFDRDPQRARGALAAIEATGRQALAELRRLLGVVHPDEDAEDPLAPPPGLDRLDGLLGQVRAAGLTVRLRTEGARFPLPSGIDLSAYRIVQEALTNTLKHAGARRADILLRYGTGEVTLEIRDDGHGPSGDGGQPGRGLIGMRQRAALYGGSLVAGPRPGGGFAVTARFPTGGP
jgi:signal transduction histidine kinase